MTWEQTAEVLAREVNRLQKENDRLKDEYQALYKRHDENLEAKYAIARVRHSYCMLRDGVQRNVELISEDIDKEWFPLLSKVQQNLLELLSPAAEGGGAAIGGESKPLVCHEMTPEETTEAAEIIRKAWEGVPKDIPIGGFEGLESASKAIVGGESQALQAAILGLHTLAGEFPTPTWKTREDYLQATISEINEILGKQ